MKNSNIILYKYYPYNEYSLEMFSSKKTWYSKPEAFNDPFDCRLNFNENIPVDKYEKCLRWQLKREGRTEQQIEEDLELLISPGGKVHDKAKKVIDKISATTLDVINNIGVLSLTEKNDSVTMWAHYAENHKGVCVGFLVSNETVPIEVTYVPKTPPVNFSNLFDDESEKDVYKWIFSKHHDWKEEKEWRIVVSQGNQLWPIPGKINTVIFGLRMDSSKKDIIKKILENESEVEYYEAMRNPNLLQLEIKQIK